MAVHQQGNWEETNNSVPFFKAQEGTNMFRVVSDPVLTLSHWIKVGANGKPIKVGCMDKKENCPLCKFGVDLLRRHCFFVLDRKDGSVKVYEAPGQVYQAIKAFAIDEDHGNPKAYDMKLIREGSNLNTKYQVLASPKKRPLSEEEEEKIAAAIASVDWNKLYPQKTAAEMEDYISNLNDEFVREVKAKAAERARRAAEKAAEKGGQPVAAAAARPAAKPASSDEDEFFSGVPERTDFTSDDLDWGDN